MTLLEGSLTRVRVDAGRLELLTTAIFERLGMPAEHAGITARGLLAADLAGHESHGISNYLDVYYDPGLRSGVINPNPRPRIVRETPTSALWDGDGGMGFVVGDIVMRDCIERAERMGMAFCSVANSRHFGMAQIYSRMAASRDMVGLSMTNGGALAVPFRGVEPRLGTNPISVAIPCGAEPPFVLDMATTAASMGKVLNAERDGRSIPGGWALDADARDTTEPRAAIEGARLLPLGSTAEGGAHKGYGLAVWVEVMCGVLSGTGFGSMLGPDNLGHFFGAIRVDLFQPVESFKATMDDLVRELRATPPRHADEPVLVAGDPEHAAEADRRVNGIPLHPRVLDMLGRYADEFGLDADLGVGAVP